MSAEAMTSRIKSAFEANSIRVPLERIRLLRPVSGKTRRSTKYAQIAASIAEVGLIEPPIVVRHPSELDAYLLLDGHLRVEILRERGAVDVLCLIATDDEAFTYNKRISRLAAVQEHRMILQAVDRNVPEERLARALNIDISTLRHKKRALQGICPEAVEVLADKPISFSAFAILRRMMPLRQIEAAELMVGMNRYSKSYAQALLVATPEDELLQDGKPKAPKALTREQVVLMERETARLDREIKVAEQSYGPDHLRMVLARTYLTKLVANVRVERWLQQHQPEMLTEFRKLVDGQTAVA
jgi:ParB-like chromosome segregation protein Spo0J